LVPVFYIYFPKTIFIIDRTIENKTAVKNPLTSKPGTILVARRMSSALITKEKSPSVKILMGKVNTNKIGLIKILIRASTKVARRVVQIPGSTTPGTIHEAIARAKALNKKCIIIQILYPKDFLLSWQVHADALSSLP
jgi:hypothetical protein